MKKSTNDLGILEDAMTMLHKSMTRHGLWEYIMAKAGVALDRPSAIILHVLNSSDSSGQHLSELSVKLGVEAPSVTRKVQDLEKEGLVKRQADQKDKRSSIIYISPKGRDVLNRIKQAKQQNLADALSGWSNDDKKKLAELCKRLADNLVEQQNPKL